ncbi:MAG TPA: OmpA family protein [Xanthomonadales bacterium]|nr:OmpA family protein [Xanthomonadales bacterium]
MGTEFNISVAGWVLFVGLTLGLTEAIAQQDMEGGADHSQIPRIDRTEIRGHLVNQYDDVEFVIGLDDDALQKQVAGGTRTRVLYIAPPSISRAEVFRNYGQALDDLGEAELMFQCDEQCPKKLGPDFIWDGKQRIPTNINQSDFMYGSLSYEDQGYAYWVVTSESARYHVAVYTASLNGLYTKQVKDTRSIHLDVVEEAGFEASLTVVTPDEIAEGISKEGRIALYGIYFDFDSDTLRADSQATLEAISSALNGNSGLNVFVVGHTDNEGSYEYNLQLSQRRAAAVVLALTTDHGIAAERLRAVGVGPVAPVASNRSEDGRSLNRRVELVEF